MDARGERGAVIVETALILPFLVALIFAILHIGQAVNYWNDTNQMAGEAARFAAVNKVPGDDIEAFLESEAANSVSDEMASTLEVDVCIDDTDGNPDTIVGDAVRVQVVSPFDLFPLVGELTGDAGLTSVDLTGAATMRLEAEPDFSAGAC